VRDFSHLITGKWSIGLWPVVRGAFIVVAGVALVLSSAAPASAVSIVIGDADGFGFASVSGLLNVNGDPADANGNGVLDVGDALPDVNQNGSAAAASGDDWDNRSAAEAVSTNDARWTDVTLSISFSDDPGDLPSANVTFTFTVPTEGEPGFELDHYLNIVAGDFGVTPLQVRVDGTIASLTAFVGGEGLLDGRITLTYVAVPWADMTDGAVNVDFSVMSNEPYVAFDYFLLAETVGSIPEPSTVPSLGAWALGLLILLMSASVPYRLKKVRPE